MWICLGVLYIGFTCFVGFLALARILALNSHSDWIEAMQGNFPSGCGSWAEENGCTRVELRSVGCVRPEQIVDENSVFFSYMDPQSGMNNAIAACISKVPGAKIMYPADLD